MELRWIAKLCHSTYSETNAKSAPACKLRDLCAAHMHILYKRKEHRWDGSTEDLTHHDKEG